MRKIPRQISERLPAADLFAEKGLNDSKIEDVAAVTGVPKATLYYYFAGKEDILCFLLEDLLKDISDAVTAIVHTDGTGAERLNSSSAHNCGRWRSGQRSAVHSSANWDERPACRPSPR